MYFPSTPIDIGIGRCAPKYILEVFLICIFFIKLKFFFFIKLKFFFFIKLNFSVEVLNSSSLKISLSGLKISSLAKIKSLEKKRKKKRLL